MKEITKLFENLAAQKEDMLFKGNEVDLDEVLEMAKKVVETTKKQNENRLDQFRNIVEGVARKYASTYVDREDLEQELWIVVLELVQAKGGEENVDPRLVAKSCFNKAVDFYRYSRRRHDSKARLIDETESDDDSFSSRGSDQNGIYVAKGRTGYDEVILKEVIDLFPPESRERKYVVTKLYMYGEIDSTSGLPDKLEYPEDDSEEAIIRLLGFKSRYPASWGKMKYSIRETIYRYLGMLPDSYECDSKKMMDILRERVETIFSESRSGYINVDKLLKDKVLILLGAEEDMLWEAMKSSRRLLRGLTKDGKKFIMKNEEKYLKNSAKNEDVILDK